MNFSYEHLSSRNQRVNKKISSRRLLTSDEIYLPPPPKKMKKKNRKKDLSIKKQTGKEFEKLKPSKKKWKETVKQEESAKRPKLH